MQTVRLIYSKLLDDTEVAALIYMVIGGFLFATMGALIHALGKYCDWLIIAMSRMFITFFITVFISIRSGINPFVFNRSLLWFRSFLGTTAMLATFYALVMLPISDVSVITETRPIWVALLAVNLLGEKNNKNIWIVIIIGLIGVALVEEPHFRERNFVVFIALLASILGSGVMICLRMLRDLDPRKIVTHFSGTSTIIALLLILFLDRTDDIAVIFVPKYLLMLIGIGLFGTAGQLAMTKAFAIGRAANVSTAGLLKVGFASMYDILIWKYMFHVSTILGMICILGSTAWLFSSSKSNINNRVRENF